MFALVITALLVEAKASPAPAMGSSQILQTEKAHFQSPLGFTITRGKTDWVLIPASKARPSIALLYRAPSESSAGVQPTLTVRTDQLISSQPLQSYVRQWTKDFHRLGFEVLSSKMVKVEGQLAYLFDVVHRDSLKQLRQVIFSNNQTAVVLTCRDHQQDFAQTVQACNEIIRTFRWSNSMDKPDHLETEPPVSNRKAKRGGRGPARQPSTRIE